MLRQKELSIDFCHLTTLSDISVKSRVVSGTAKAALMAFFLQFVEQQGKFGTKELKMGARRQRHAAGALLALFFLGISVSLMADTYNFYFSKPSKTNPTAKDENANETGEKPAEDSAPAPTQTQPAPKESATGQTAPIVIHNVNNNNSPGSSLGMPTTSPAPAAGLSAPQAAPAVPAGNAVAATVVAPRAERSPWKMALTGMMMLDNYEYQYSSPSGKDFTYSSKSTNWGGLVSVGYSFSRVVGLNLYGGARSRTPFKDTFHHLGLDLEIIPVRIPVAEDMDIFEFGILAGASNARAARENFASAHAGVRVNFNFAKQFGITASGRANLGYMLFEAGLTARL
ncbi:MAG: hypothetical protein HY537_03400 [Deltaproteobacteria bacterium]|nr:hypothetical protein [Deltaproteobacteria bacterium]